MSRMASIEHLLTRILPQTLPCPRSMALDALQAIAVDFFTESGAWNETIQEMAGCCEGTISPQLPKGARLAGIYELYMDGQKLEKSGYYEDGRNVYLKEPLNRQACAIMQATLRPLRTATELPEDLLEEYGDYLIYGAIARLKAMSGIKVEWSDPKGAELNYSLYQEGLARAKSRKYRKRFGAGMTYIQTAELE